MDNQQKTPFFFAFDGDGIGKRHGDAILSDNIEEISHISSEITEANQMVRDFVESHGGQMISFGGDEGLFAGPADFIDLLEQVRKDYQYMVGATLSIGYGTKPSEAGKALLAAKTRGKNQVVQYDESVEQEDLGQEDSLEKKKINAVVNSSESNADKGVGHEQVNPTDADSVQNEPTLSEPPNKDNNFGYDSGYKNSNVDVRDDSYRGTDDTPPAIKKPNLLEQTKIPEAVSTDYPECDRQMNEVPSNPEEKGPMIPKPAPKGYHGQAEGEAPQSQAQPREDKPSDIKYTPGAGEQIEPQADMPIENATSDVAEEAEAKDMGTKHCASCTCNAHDDSPENTLDQHIENAQDMVADAESGDDKDSENTLDVHVSNASEMNQDMDENGVSRPADYNQKDGDLGLSEEDATESEDPELSEVLQGGLDQHAEDIQREKAVQLVGQALNQFKSQKQILDKAKEQAPELHDACISMLKAMIELCTLAGINNGEAEEVDEIEGQEESQESPNNLSSEQKESRPNCGKPHDKNAAPQEGAPKTPQS